MPRSFSQWVSKNRTRQYETHLINLLEERRHLFVLDVRNKITESHVLEVSKPFTKLELWRERTLKGLPNELLPVNFFLWSILRPIGTTRKLFSLWFHTSRLFQFEFLWKETSLFPFLKANRILVTRSLNFLTSTRQPVSQHTNLKLPIQRCQWNQPSPAQLCQIIPKPPTQPRPIAILVKIKS